MEQLIRLYEQWAGGKPATIEKVKGAGSNRIYSRLTDEAAVEKAMDTYNG